MSTDAVNVVAVLDKHIKAERALGYEASAREAERARAALIELLEAVEIEYHMPMISRAWPQARLRVTAALQSVWGIV